MNSSKTTLTSLLQTSTIQTTTYTVTSDNAGTSLSNELGGRISLPSQFLKIEDDLKQT